MRHSPALRREAGRSVYLLVAVLSVSVLCGSSALAQKAQVSSSASPATATPPSSLAPSKAKAARQAKASPAGKPAGPASRSLPNRFAGRAGIYYRLLWGVDSLQVRWGESGEVIRFNYRVLDADKAKGLNDAKTEPSLVDPQAGVRLVVPAMENVGLLRQTAAPEDGKSYWIVFSNKGRLVKRGDHVNVLIGSFHANGLVVD